MLWQGTLNGWCNFLTYKNVKDNNYNSFKSIIKENYKYSREELANKLGVSCTTINNYIKEFKNSNEFDWEYFKKYKIFNKDAILQLTKENNIIKRWSGTNDICNNLNITYAALSSCLCGKSNTCNGYKWVREYEYYSQIN